MDVISVMVQRWMHVTEVYTDGFKSTSDTNLAIVFPSYTYKFPLHPELSILTIELYAIFFALQYMSSISSSSYTIFTLI